MKLTWMDLLMEQAKAVRNNDADGMLLASLCKSQFAQTAELEYMAKDLPFLICDHTVRIQS